MRILSAAFLPLLLLAPSISEAQPKKKPEPIPNGPVGKAVGACGVRILPLVEGNSWTYGFVAAPTQAPPDLVKLMPSQPSEITITVKSVETKGPDTVVTLEEKSVADLSKDPKKHILDERKLTTTITCNAKKFEISPDSFFFAGEPGGSYGVTFDKIERPKDTSWKLVGGTIGDSPWREEIVAHFTRTAVQGSGAKLDSGKLELERAFTPQQPERLNTKVGLYTAEKLGLVTTGRVTLDHPGAPAVAAQPATATTPAVAEVKPGFMELPAGWYNQIWLVNNVGVVQVLNAYAHMYLLTAVTLK